MMRTGSALMTRWLVVVLVVVVASVGVPAASARSEELQELKQEIDQLQKRVAELEARLSDVEGDDARTLEVGVAWATQQCRALLDGGAPGIHFYTMNRSPATRRVFQELRGS